MIWKNFMRELGYTTSRLLSVIVIITVAVFIHVGLSGIPYNSDRMAKNYYSRQNIADYWITGTRIDRTDIRALRRIHGISEVQPRIVLDAEQWRNENVTLTLYAIADGYHINIPFLVEGDYPKNSREMMVSSAFAEQQNLRIGDTYEMVISGTEQRISKTICALIKNPECLFHVGANTPTPDFSKYGFAYMNEGALEDIWEANTYNQVCIKVENGVSAAYIKSQISTVLGQKAISVLALADNDRAYNLANQTETVRMIIVIFPIMFFLVAILIMFSTMSRLIENARTSIGTMKALGYADRTILLYYLLYAVMVAVVGFTIGVLPANQIITKSIMSLTLRPLDLPAYQILPDLSAWASSFLLACTFSIGTTFIITEKALREKPVECMRPRPPKKVKKLMLEKIPLLWNRLNFSMKYIVRNIFRNKAKMFICVVGVSGCMALILASLSMKDSIDNYLELLITNQHKYDVLLTFDRSVTREQYEHIGKMEIVSGVQYEMSMTAKIYASNQLETARFIVTDNVIVLSLIDAYSPPIFMLPEDGVIIGKDIADKLGYRVGDIAIISFSGDRNYYAIPIQGVLAGVNGIYAGRDYWRSLSKGFSPTSIYVKTSDIDKLEPRISNFDFVSSMTHKDALSGAVSSRIASMSTIVYILIAFGAVLALVVLYNLGIMSFYEQIRNSATLLVLGFYDKETRELLLTENIIFTLIGIIIGAPFGTKMAQMILGYTGSIEFELTVRPFSYVLAATITMCFAMIVNMIIGRKMKHIDMLGALKSVE